MCGRSTMYRYIFFISVQSLGLVHVRSMMACVSVRMGDMVHLHSSIRRPQRNRGDHGGGLRSIDILLWMGTWLSVCMLYMSHDSRWIGSVGFDAHMLMSLRRQGGDGRDGRRFRVRRKIDVREVARYLHLHL